MQLNENQIRECAYKIWEDEGRPEGKAEKHWSMACKFLQSEQGQHAKPDGVGVNSEHETETFVPHQNSKKGKHAHHASHPH